PGEVSLSDGAAAGGFGSGTVDVTVTATSQNDLAPATDAVYKALASTPHISDITSDLAPAEPTVQVAVNRAKALGHGLTVKQLLGAVAAILSPQSVGKVRIDDVNYPIYVDSAPPPATPDALREMTVPTATGAVP